MSAPIRLLIYSHFFSPSIGGVESVVESLAGGLTALRYPEGSPEFLVTLATEIAADSTSDRTFPFLVCRKPGLRQLWRLIRSVDLLHCAGPAFLPMALAWLARKPFIVEHHSYQAICPNGLLLLNPKRTICPGHFQLGEYAACLRCLRSESSAAHSVRVLSAMFPRQFFARRAAAHLAVSSHVAGRILFPRTRIIYHGVEDTGLSAISDSAILDPEVPLCFAYVGRFVPEKGIATLLEAAAKLRHRCDFRIRLIGDGPQRPLLEQIIAGQQLGRHVTTTGFLRGEALALALADIVAVVMPSAWEETAGLAAIEQMMRGRLVIASQIGGLAEIVGDAALLFPPGDAAALARCIERVLDNRSEVLSLGKKARQRALGLLRQERMIEEHAALFRRTLQSGNTGTTPRESDTVS